MCLVLVVVTTCHSRSYSRSAVTVSSHSGKKSSSTVDTYPGETFEGVVAPDQPRLNASMNQNVVTYTVVVNTDNSDGKLLPYLTANVQFQVDRRVNVRKVPNTALRWKPAPEQVVPELQSESIQKQRLREAAA